MSSLSVARASVPAFFGSSSQVSPKFTAPSSKSDWPSTAIAFSAATPTACSLSAWATSPSVAREKLPSSKCSPAPSSKAGAAWRSLAAATKAFPSPSSCAFLIASRGGKKFSLPASSPMASRSCSIRARRATSRSCSRTTSVASSYWWTATACAAASTPSRNSGPMC